jgi:hypothetical protein
LHTDKVAERISRSVAVSPTVNLEREKNSQEETERTEHENIMKDS